MTDSALSSRLGDLVVQHFLGRPSDIDKIGEIVIIAHIHCLPSTTGTLFKWLTELERPPRALIVVPKPYSTIPEAVTGIRRLGIKVIDAPDLAYPTYGALSLNMLKRGFDAAALHFRASDRLLLLDDGGLLTDMWSKTFRSTFPHAVSVQQTTSGTYRRDWSDWQINVVDAARSCAKSNFESVIIARGILRKLQKLPEYEHAESIGVVGLGAIGGHVAGSFAHDGKRVFGYDNRQNVACPRGVRRARSIYELLDQSKVVVGCTGKNWLYGKSRREKLLASSHTLISCSSRDVEFHGILQAGYADRTDGIFSTIHIERPETPTQTVLNGGFPINFDRRKEWEQINEITLTRAIVLAAVLQAALLPPEEDETKTVQLDAVCQKLIVLEWLKFNNFRARLFGLDDNDLQDLAWWKSTSGGECVNFQTGETGDY
jgi:hypothetical protein